MSERSEVIDRKCRGRVFIKACVSRMYEKFNHICKSVLGLSVTPLVLLQYLSLCTEYCINMLQFNGIIFSIKCCSSRKVVAQNRTNFDFPRLQLRCVSLTVDHCAALHIGASGRCAVDWINIFTKKNSTIKFDGTVTPNVML